MFKLTKYELRKTRTTLLIAAACFALLELAYILGLALHKEDLAGGSASFLVLFAVFSYLFFLILAIMNYSKEMNSKSSYLIFMTPNTPLAIISAKMLMILLVGLTSLLVYALLCWLDIRLLIAFYPDAEMTGDLLAGFAKGLGVDLPELGFTLLALLIAMIVTFFLLVTLAYLAITLSATFLQNFRFKGWIGCILFLAFFMAATWIDNHLIPALYPNPATWQQLWIGIAPSCLFYIILMILATFACSVLLEKKVSL